MKLIRHRPSRRVERLNWTETALERKPQKRALLVGIQYEKDADNSDDDVANSVLRGPHQDVTDMRDLLIGELRRHYWHEDADEPVQTVMAMLRMI